MPTRCHGRGCRSALPDCGRWQASRRARPRLADAAVGRGRRARPAPGAGGRARGLLRHLRGAAAARRARPRPGRSGRTRTWSAAFARARRRRACGATRRPPPTPPAPDSTSCSRPAPRPASRWPTSCPALTAILERAGAAASAGRTTLYIAPDQGARPGPARPPRGARARRPGRPPTTATARRAARLGPRPRRVRPHQPRHAAPLAAAGARPLGAVLRVAATYVVVDECHHYRGVFGAHVAQVLRRLRRVCALYGADPTFVLASATVAEPESTAARLTGARRDRGDRRRLAARRGRARAVGAAVHRRTPARTAPPCAGAASSEAADLLADLVAEGVRTLAFVRSRRGAEQVALDRGRAARRGRPVAARAGRRLPRRLPARGAPRDRAGAARRAAARAGRDQRARARHRRQRPRRRADGRLPRHPRGAVAAGRPGRPQRRRRARRSWSPATTRSTPTSSPTPRRCSAGRSRRPSSTPPTPTSSGRTCARPPQELPLTEADLPLFGADRARRCSTS